MSYTPTKEKFKLPTDSSEMTCSSPLNTNEDFYGYQNNQEEKPNCVQSSFSASNQYVEKDYVLDLTSNQSTASVSTLPIENLSIHQSITNEWISPLETGYSNYNQNEMNFIYAYNQLVTDAKNFSTNDINTSTPSEVSSTTTEDLTGNSNLSQNTEYQNNRLKSTEQVRRFSMMDIYRDSSNSIVYSELRKNPAMATYEDQTQATSFGQSFFGSSQKERSSMPNVLVTKNQSIAANSAPLAGYMSLSKQQELKETGNAGRQLTWQQSSLLQKRPVDEAPATKYNDVSLHASVSTPSEPSFTVQSSTSYPLSLKKYTKKRSIAEETLHEGVPYSVISMPFVAPSLSEPIPTGINHNNWVHSTNARKRTKSIRGMEDINEGSSPEPVIATSNAAMHSNFGDGNESDDQIGIEHDIPLFITTDVIKTSVPTTPTYETSHTISSTTTTNPITATNNNNHGEFDLSGNQMLAAMPRRQKLRYDGDAYTPKWVRYTGHLKEGYCDSCNPGKWLQLKNSAYWYHKQFYHGISSVSGKSFMKPLEQRMGKGDMIEGLCHQCRRFVPACNGKKKNNFMLWYRHAHKCHLYDKPKAAAKNIRKTSVSHKGVI